MIELTRRQIEGWKMNNGSMSPNEFRALCDLALANTTLIEFVRLYEDGKLGTDPEVIAAYNEAINGEGTVQSAERHITQKELEHAVNRLGLDNDLNTPDWQVAEIIFGDIEKHSEPPCETCKGDPAVCATVPGLRHCEAAQRTPQSHARQTDEEFAKEQAERIVNSADAQCFRWLLKHHSGTGKAMAGVGQCCWIGGVQFRGDDVRTAIIDAIDREDGTAPSAREERKA